VPWSSFVRFLIMTLAMWWIWQEGSRHVATQTIPYSQFRDALREGEVIECLVGQAEIMGMIRPHGKAASEST